MRKRRLSITPIPRVRRLSPATFAADFEAPLRPVVIEGAAARWSAVSKWSHAWFQEQFGDEVVSLAVGSRRDSHFEERTLGEAIEEMAIGGHAVYLRQFPLLDRLPALRRDFAPPRYCRRGRYLITNLWLGPAGTVQPFHKDNHHPRAALHNIFVQIAGRKKVVLAGPDDERCMYPRTEFARDPNHSRVDFDEPDLDRFPLFAEAHFAEAVVEPGDMIFIPAGTWHYLRALEPSISLSFWWHASRVADILFRLLALTSRDAPPRAPRIARADVEAFGGPTALLEVARGLTPSGWKAFLTLCSPAVVQDLRRIAGG